MSLRSGALMPGIVVLLEPLHLVCLANLSKSLGEPFLALKRIDAGDLDFTAFKIGDILPCVAYFEDIGLDERWGDVHPRPLAWATGDKKTLDYNKMRLDLEDLRILDESLRFGKLPHMEGELLLLNTNCGDRPA